MTIPQVAEHVGRFGQALKPVLQRVADNLRPHAASATLDAPVKTMVEALTALGIGVGRFVAAVADIPREILAFRSCNDVTSATLVGRMHIAVEEITALRDWAWGMAQRSDAGPRERIFHGVVRDVLVDISSWLANFVRVTAEPQRFVVFDEWGGEAEVSLSLSLLCPDSVTDLDAWIGADTVFPAEKIADALRTTTVRLSSLVGRPPPSVPPSPVPASTVSPRQPSVLCSIGGGLLLGALLSDWLDD